jgi:hypothetical protein
MKENPWLVAGGILLIVFLVFVGYKIVAVSVGPVTVKLENPSMSNEGIVSPQQTSRQTEPAVPEIPTEYHPKHAIPGSYPIKWVLKKSDSWIVTLIGIEIYNDGQFKLNITLRNNSSSHQTLICEDNEEEAYYLVLPDGFKIFPSETACTGRVGEEVDLAPGESVVDWAIFPPLEDAAVPFDVIWSYWGTANNVILPNGD